MAPQIWYLLVRLHSLSSNFRLKDELNRLQEKAEEHQQLNTTLQLELSVYDKMHEEKKVDSKHQFFFNFHMFFQHKLFPCYVGFLFAINF